MLLAQQADGSAIRGGGGSIPLTGMVAWLEADTGVTLTSGKVSTWADTQSGTGFSVTQATAGLRPTVDSAAINGHDAILCTSATSLLNAASPLTAGSDRSIVAIVKGGGSAGASGGVMCSFRTANPKLDAYFWDLSPNVYCYGDGTNADNYTSPPTVVSTVNCVELYTQVGSLPVCFVGGASKAVSGAHNVVSDSGTDGFFAINNQSGAQGFIGDIAVIMIWSRVLTAGEKTAVRAYCSAKYGAP